MQRGDQSRFRPLLVHCTAPHQHSTESGLVDKRRLERGRRPFRGIYLLHVVHEVQPVGPRSARIERGENAGLPIGWNFRNFVESRFTQIAHREIATLCHSAILGGDRRLPNPLLKPLHRCVTTLVGFGRDRHELGRVRAPCPSHGSERRAGYRTLKKPTPID